jgi:hypothetical protein
MLYEHIIISVQEKDFFSLYFQFVIFKIYSVTVNLNNIINFI